MQKKFAGVARCHSNISWRFSERSGRGPRDSSAQGERKAGVRSVQ